MKENLINSIMIIAVVIYFNWPFILLSIWISFTGTLLYILNKFNYQGDLPSLWLCFILLVLSASTQAINTNTVSYPLTWSVLLFFSAYLFRVAWICYPLDDDSDNGGGNDDDDPLVPDIPSGPTIKRPMTLL